MPVQPTYPGVYIEEVPSAIRTIIGVPTAITAFIGRALKGPVNQPVTIHGMGEFERIFGGLWKLSNLGYAVRDFFRNAQGGEAIIVRLVNDGAAATINAKGLDLVARSEGTWGNRLRVHIDHDTANGADDLFNLTVAEVEHDAQGKVAAIARIEVFRNVSVKPESSRRVDKVLESESALVRMTGELPQQRPDAHDNPTTATPLWGLDNQTSSPAAENSGNDGTHLEKANFVGEEATEANRKGLYALESVDIFNLLVIPPFLSSDPNERPADIDPGLLADAIPYVEKRRAMLIIDPPSKWTAQWNSGTKSAVVRAASNNEEIGDPTKNAALYFPRLLQPDPMRDGQWGEFAPAGAVAGVYARTDRERGVWKAPAGIEATLVGVPDLSVQLTDAENGELNPLGVNALRIMPAAGRIVWGARTRRGADRLADQWKYIPVRRTALFIEESLYRGTQWAVFEPNDEPLWASLRLNIGAFMHSLFRQGAFQGRQPSEAYRVQVDRETTTQDDINRGIVNILVGFAPLKPAEFVIIRIQQLAGQVEV